jgi:phage terminase large subunit-like protein
LTASWLASLPESERQRFLQGLSKDEKEELFYTWRFWARDEQLEPSAKWYIWMLLAGRGFGKTRVGAEAVREKVESGKWGRIHLIGQTAADARDVMVEGDSGILACSPPWFYPKYEPSKRRVTWPNGAVATTFSGDEPDQLRGPQAHGAWADELAKWKYAQDAWDNMEFGLRLGDEPQAVVTTTPRPIPIIKGLIKDQGCIVTRGKTRDNIGNLAATFIERVLSRYEGTRIGRQELDAEILDDNPGALWTRANIEKNRVREVPDLKCIVVGVDPQVGDPEKAKAADKTDDEAAETGIVVAGVTEGRDPHAYVLEDATCSGSPHEWGSAAVTAYHKNKANWIIAEANNGGAMVEYVIGTVARDGGQRVPIILVHASRGKQTRAEPVSALYEQNKVHHVGCFPELEDQMCEWVPGMKSPDRMDALVWALTRLIVTVREPRKTETWRGRSGGFA